MQMHETAFLNQVERAAKHRFGLGRKPGDEIRAERHIRAHPPDLFAEADRIRAQMPALHALENQVVAGLEREMQVRHQPGFTRNGVA
jgi:hypothetical protein